MAGADPRGEKGLLEEDGEWDRTDERKGNTHELQKKKRREKAYIL